MSKHIFLNFFILSTVVSQGITSLSYNRSADSLDFLLRKKRVIDRACEYVTPSLPQVPYVVSVLENGKHVCSGIILSPYFILSAASCFLNKSASYIVVSGSVLKEQGERHAIDQIINHPQFRRYSHEYAYNLVILSIREPIIFGPNANGPAPLYNGQLPPHSLVTTSGWGLSVSPDGKTYYPKELRTINLFTLELGVCRSRLSRFGIHADDLICTFNDERRCGHGDGGNPLVFNGHLVGVLAWDGSRRPSSGSDIFVNVTAPEYKNWIHKYASGITPQRPGVHIQRH